MRFAILAVALCAPGVPVAAQDAPTLVIGGDNAKGVELVNPIAVIAVGPRVVILERTSPHLRVLSSSGQLIQTLGRAGEGPGEFQRPITLLYDSTTSRVLVVDRLRVTYYALRDTLTFVATRRLAILPSAACMVGGRLWIVRREDRGLLHEVSLTGDELTVARSVGPIPVSEAANLSEIRGIMAAGPVVCDPARRTAHVISRVFGEVRVFSLASSQSQLYTLPGFVPAEIKMGGEKGIQLGAPPSGEYDEVIGALLTAQAPLVIVGRKTRAETRPDEYASFRVFHLGSMSAAAPINTGLSRPIGASGSGVLCYSQDPVPTILRFAGGKCPSR